MTLAATVLANRHSIVWRTKFGIRQSNYIVSVLRASTIRLGVDPITGKDVSVPLGGVSHMVYHNDLVLRGRDISGLPLDKAMARAGVLPWDLQRQLTYHMANLGKSLSSIYYPDVIAANQEARADNLIPGNDRQTHLENSHHEVSPSALFAVAAILEGEPFINGALQNTFVPCVVELVEQRRLHCWRRSQVGPDQAQVRLRGALGER